MLHQNNPTLITISKARTNGLLPCSLQIKQLSQVLYTLVDQEGVTYGNFNTYTEAAATKVLVESNSNVL